MNKVYNVAVGESTSLHRLFELLRGLLAGRSGLICAPVYRPFRDGDVRDSRADIGLARELLRYEPTHDLRAGLREALPWYLRKFGATTAAH